MAPSPSLGAPAVEAKAAPWLLAKAAAAGACRRPCPSRAAATCARRRPTHFRLCSAAWRSRVCPPARRCRWQSRAVSTKAKARVERRPRPAPRASRLRCPIRAARASISERSVQLPAAWVVSVAPRAAAARRATCAVWMARCSDAAASKTARPRACWARSRSSGRCSTCPHRAPATHRRPATTQAHPTPACDRAAQSCTVIRAPICRGGLKNRRFKVGVLIKLVMYATSVRFRTNASSRTRLSGSVKPTLMSTRV